MKPWATYMLLRAALFVAPFAALMVANVPWYFALVIALLFAFCASYVFLRKQRDAAAGDIERWRTGRKADGSDDDDDLVEDAAVDEVLDGESAEVDGEPAVDAEPTPDDPR